MKKLIGYCRVSTDEQGASKNGLEAQRAAIVKFAEENGYSIVEIVDEVASGALGLNDRPVLAAAIAKANKVKAHVVVNKLDRLSRNAAFILNLMETNAKFIVTELGEGVDSFMLHIYAVVAQKEREMISQRTKAALAQLKLKGVKLGNPTNLPEAAQAGRETQAHRAKLHAQRLLPTISRMKAEGMTLRQIADELNATGMATARGGKWHASGVRNVIERF